MCVQINWQSMSKRVTEKVVELVLRQLLKKASEVVFKNETLETEMDLPSTQPCFEEKIRMIWDDLYVIGMKETISPHISHFSPNSLSIALYPRCRMVSIFRNAETECCRRFSWWMWTGYFLLIFKWTVASIKIPWCGIHMQVKEFCSKNVCSGFVIWVLLLTYDVGVSDSRAIFKDKVSGAQHVVGEKSFPERVRPWHKNGLDSDSVRRYVWIFRSAFCAHCDINDECCHSSMTVRRGTRYSGCVLKTWISIQKILQWVVEISASLYFRSLELCSIFGVKLYFDNCILYGFLTWTFFHWTRLLLSACPRF